MFTKVKFYMIVVGDNESTAWYMQIASRHNLVCLHKIGIYEDRQQHELYVKGHWLNMVKFMREVNRLNSK